MYRGLLLAVVVPAFNEARLLPRTLRSMPSYVDRVLVVDDASQDETAAVARALGDPRVEVITHAQNRGVGGAIVTGYRRALEGGADAVAVMAADAQMDPADLPVLLDALIDEDADYVKGDRLRYPGARRMMPRARFAGTWLLARLTRLTSGYRELDDSQCGYTVARRRVLERLPLDEVFPRYGYPNDVINRLGDVGARLVQRPVRPVYGDEVSGFTIPRVIAPISGILMRGALRRARRTLASRGLWMVALFLLGLGLGWWARPASSGAIAEPQPRHKAHARLLLDAVQVLEEHHIRRINGEELIFRAIESLVDDLDRHSNFMRPRAYQRWRARIHGRETGPGFNVERLDGEERVRIVSVSPGSPAERAGIHSGDVLLRVDDEAVEGMTLKAIRKTLKGRVGTTVVLEIRPAGSAPEAPVRALSLVRERVRQVALTAHLLEPGYAHIHVTSFQKGGASDVAAAVERLETEAGALRGVVLDLRGNLGGLFHEAVAMADLFLPEGALIVVQRGRAFEKRHVSRSPARFTHPLVVLVNGRSASASELLAAALQEHGRGLVVGLPTYGKGSVQSTYPMPDGSGLKITTSLYFSPEGRKIDARGVPPDVEVEEDAEVTTLTAPSAAAPFGADVTDRGLRSAVELLEAHLRLRERPRRTTYTPIATEAIDTH